MRKTLQPFLCKSRKSEGLRAFTLLGLGVISIFIMGAERKRLLTPNEKMLVGQWWSGNGMGTIRLNLLSDGRYKAESSHCLGQSGRGKGIWELTNGFLVTHPKIETGDMDLKPLQVTNVNGHIYLIKGDKFSQKFFTERGPSRASSFKRDT